MLFDIWLPSKFIWPNLSSYSLAIHCIHSLYEQKNLLLPTTYNFKCGYYWSYTIVCPAKIFNPMVEHIHYLNNEVFKITFNQENVFKTINFHSWPKIFSRKKINNWVISWYFIIGLALGDATIRFVGLKL